MKSATAGTTMTGITMVSTTKHNSGHDDTRHQPSVVTGHSIRVAEQAP